MAFVGMLAALALPGLSVSIPIQNQSSIVGAALSGLTNMEDWFFSGQEGIAPLANWPFDEVAGTVGLPQGRFFPSDTLDANYIDPWYTVGDLVGVTSKRLGEDRVVQAITDHREQYITEADFRLMSENGVGHTRIPLGWWTFLKYPLPEAPGIVPDLCYPDKKFVTLSQAYLESLLALGAKHDVQILLDIHSMPCGSSDGTYSGVFPEKPRFFLNDTAMALGLEVLDNMYSWYHSLDAELKGVVHGFTLMNEPGLGLVGDGLVLPNNATIMHWLGKAVDGYKRSIVANTSSPPLLYMNLHEAAFPGVGGLTQLLQMAGAAAEMGLRDEPWAVFDVHHYFAWAGDGDGIKAEDCATNLALESFVRTQMANWTSQVTWAAGANGLSIVACSEWSLSLHHKDHISPCAAPDALEVMYQAQLQAFEAAGMANYMWGWRMPMGGVHEPQWSLKYHLTGQH